MLQVCNINNKSWKIYGNYPKFTVKMLKMDIELIVDFYEFGQNRCIPYGQSYQQR